MSPVTLSYELGDHGWASFALKIGDASATAEEFGYCTDALGDLIQLASACLGGASEAKASFDGEPFEWRLVVRRPLEADRSLADVQLLTFDDISNETPDCDGREILRARCLPRDLAAAVANAAQAILDRYGEKEYDRRWGPQWTFPLRELRELQVSLNDTPSDFGAA